MIKGGDFRSPKTGYAPVSGLELYYEVHGTGNPLVLLHGGLGAVGMFGELLHTLAANRQVVAVDLQAHGRTADIDRPLRYEQMADDVAALLAHLGFDKVSVIGYSLGGGGVLQTAIRHPDMVRKLVVVSNPFRRDGWYPENLAGVDRMGPEAAEPMKQSPTYEVYSSIAPKVEDWPVLFAKLGDLLRRDYDWSAGVAVLPMPTLLVFGDADSVNPAHAAEFFGLLGGGQRGAGWDGSGMPQNRLAILPGTTHYDIFSSPALASTVAPFLDAPMPENDAAEGGARSSGDRPESDLPGGLARPAQRALAGAGYSRLEQLTRISEADVPRLPGMGPKALDQPRRALAARGRSFADGQGSGEG